jgi:hypothetical protein
LGRKGTIPYSRDFISSFPLMEKLLDYLLEISVFIAYTYESSLRNIVGGQLLGIEIFVIIQSRQGLGVASGS